jgi:hypothetical protein
VTDAERADSPPWRNCREGLKHKPAIGELRMGHHELARAEWSTAPQYDIEIEDARAPALARAATELAFDRFEVMQHSWRIEFALDHGNGIREVATGASVRWVEDDWRGVE